MLVFASCLADATTPMLCALEAYGESIVQWLAVVLPLLESVTPVASPADLVLVYRELCLFACLVEVNRTKCSDMAGRSDWGNTSSY